MQTRHLTDRPETVTCDSKTLSEALRAATAWLELNRERINALNVFPVPDGDTGDNMLLTMRGAMSSIEASGSESMAAVCDALAEGALNGSRGNSGVILSQMIAGFSGELRAADEISTRALAAAFTRAAELGCKAHSEPVEGTMMTVARDLAQEARERADAGDSLPEFLGVVLAAARESVARTQTLLPRLRQAGVVDAGGEGVAVLLAGVVRYLAGEPLDEAPEITETADFGSLELSEDDVFGYCTNFLLRGGELDVDAFRDKVLSLGRSALVIGNANLIKVHVHTERPGEILSHALSMGTLHQIKLDNMDDQYREVRKERPREEPPAPVTTALVAVTAGDGFRRLFEGDARALVVEGGQSRNPSTGDLSSAIDRSPSDHVILIPNNPNVIMSAQQAAEGAKKQVIVVPTRSSPVGVVAALAYNPDASLQENHEAMEAAIEDVSGIEITLAVRDAEIDGVSVRQGDHIGLVDDRLVGAHADLVSLALSTLEEAGANGKELLTLYYGREATPDVVERVSEEITRRFPELELDVQDGGQPDYVFVASLE